MTLTSGVRSLTYRHWAPLPGGVLTDHVSGWYFSDQWFRCLDLVLLCLNLNPTKNGTWKELVNDFDFIGLGLILDGVVCILLGTSETAWRSAETITLLVVGGLLIVASAMKKSPIVTPRLFVTRMTAVILIALGLQAIVFVTGALYLPLYYQILGASATDAGVKMLPFSLGAALVSSSGTIVSKSKEYVPLYGSVGPTS